ncbi:MAG: hypothetical protein ACT4O0_03650 [Pseudonocardia sp.]
MSVLSGMLWTDLTSELDERVLRRVELKVQLDGRGRDDDQLATLLGLRDFQARQLHYVDDATRSLDRCGLVVRVRVNERGGSDLTVKLRSEQRPVLPPEVRKLSRLSVELDALPARTLWCAAIKHPIPDRAVSTPAAHSWLALGSAEQRIFLDCFLGRPGMAGDPALFGPVSVRRLIGRAAGLRLALESCRYPDGRHLLELSTKCRPQRAEAAAARLRRLMHAHGLVPSARQFTKTEVSLRGLPSSA